MAPPVSYLPVCGVLKIHVPFWPHFCGELELENFTSRPTGKNPHYRETLAKLVGRGFDG